MVIYRKYRPQTFSEVIGQDNTIKILANEIKQSKIAHAYLFTGSRGLGKTTLARLVSKALNCTNRKKGQSEPCNTCQSCKDVTTGRFIDLIELDAASQTGVDNVRENIIAYSRIPPIAGKYKIFVIDECHQLSIAAFNALLKTLEEPPPNILFILATTEIHKLPETIISRCQRFNFAKVDLDKIVHRLEKITQSEKIKVNKEVLRTIAQRSQGCVRDAESLLDQVLALNGKEITLEEASLVIPPTQINSIIDFLKFVFGKDKSGAVQYINQLLEEGVDLEQVITDVIEFLRKILLVKIGSATDKLYWQHDDKTQAQIKTFAKESDIHHLVSILEEFISIKTKFSYVEIPQLPLELAILKVCE